MGTGTESRIEVEPGVFEVKYRTPAFFRVVKEDKAGTPMLYRVFIRERSTFEDATGQRLDRKPVEVVTEVPGSSLRRALETDSPELLARGVDVMEPVNFEIHRLVPVE